MNNRKLTPGGATAAAAPAVPWYLAGGVSAANCVGAYQAIGAADLASSYINLANPGTYDLTTAAAPTWDDVNGWQGATNKYLATGIVPVIGGSFLARYTGASAAGAIHIFGSYSSGAECSILPNNSSKAYVINGASDNSGKAPQLEAGILGAAGYTSYRNGVQDKTELTAYSTAPTQPLSLLCHNINGTRQRWFLGQLQAFVYYDVTLTPLQMLAVSAAMEALPGSTPPF